VIRLLREEGEGRGEGLLSECVVVGSWKFWFVGEEDG